MRVLLEKMNSKKICTRVNISMNFVLEFVTTQEYALCVYIVNSVFALKVDVVVSKKNGIKTKIQLQNFNEIKINLEILVSRISNMHMQIDIITLGRGVQSKVYVHSLFTFIGSKLTNVHAVIQFNGFMNLCKIRIFSNQNRCAHDSTMLCMRFKRKSSFYDGASGFVC